MDGVMFEGASRPAVQKEFDSTIAKRGEPFLVVTLVTTGPQSTNNTPVIVQGSPLKGKIHLSLKKPDAIFSIILTVRGMIVTGGGAFGSFDGYTFVFLDQKYTQQKAALKGDHTWPFSIDLPDEAEMTEGVDHQPKMFRLPQTFHQRFIHATIKYEVEVKITRKGILKSNDTLSAPFIYIPVIRPPPLPPLRRLAYEEGIPLLGPKIDPDGWLLPKTVEIKGTLLNNRRATRSVECRLFLAKPLSYTRGSVIPLFLTLESDDKQVLDLLSSPQAISVRVRRRTRYNSEPHKAFESKVWRDDVDHSQRAVWSHATDYAGEEPPDSLRMLDGELHLKSEMAPTSAMGNYSINYSVVLLSFNTPGFKVEEGPVLLEHPITIVTSFAPGPRPKATTPADFTPDIRAKADELQTNGEFSRGFY
ncbi:hypothetical protein GALMADRAFT_278851 [Galerina marginata CBS 339.88]|uniref:Arrestin-like N-terminal domain-containing protein n=1 Tax=Galerina marginata (strain CBS 339.88) TaxID=685588 RepID=A0A067T1F2_GALM3|nr:hypothetical protein GALMADRAFT_278851 [Galerina marginata CBS 339.88]